MPSRPKDPEMSVCDYYDQIIATQRANLPPSGHPPENKENEIQNTDSDDGMVQPEQETGQNKVDSNMSQNRKRRKSSSNEEYDQRKEKKKTQILSNRGKQLFVKLPNKDGKMTVYKACDPPARDYSPPTAYGPVYYQNEPEEPGSE